jgi:hypothetical protein
LGFALETVGAGVVILSARIAAERRVLVPVCALVEVEVGAAHRAMEVVGGGCCSSSGGLRGLHGLHSWMVLSFYYFSLPYPLANFFFNFLNFKSIDQKKGVSPSFFISFISFNCVLFIVLCCLLC